MKKKSIRNRFDFDFFFVKTGTKADPNPIKYRVGVTETYLWKWVHANICTGMLFSRVLYLKYFTELRNVSSTHMVSARDSIIPGGVMGQAATSL